MAAPWLFFLFSFITLSCLAAATKPNNISIPNSVSALEDDSPWRGKPNPPDTASRTRMRHLNSLSPSLLKTNPKVLLKIAGKNNPPTVSVAKPPKFVKREHNNEPNQQHGESSNTSIIKIPLFPRSFGAYSMSLRFGTPPQTIPVIMDTSSSFVWLPCTNSYRCSNCSFQKMDPTKIQTFKPDRSASSKKMLCKSEKCAWIHGRNVVSGCGPAQPCPDYESISGRWYSDGISVGSTSGHLMLDALEETRVDFLVGCSFSSTNEPLGGAGFGDSPESLPSQLGLAKFSYCLLSHSYDDSMKSTDLVLDFHNELEAQGLTYTPLVRAPTVHSSCLFYGFRYLNLREIIVGQTHVKIPDKLRVIGPDGNGGTIVDSSSPYTYMERSIYQSVTREFEKQMARYERAPDVGVLGPCFKLNPTEKLVSYPALALLFEGGAKMELMSVNYLLLADKSNTVCVSFVTDVVGSIGLNIKLSCGPSIILGNHLQQSTYMEFDLQKRRLGFLKRAC